MFRSSDPTEGFRNVIWSVLLRFYRVSARLADVSSPLQCPWHVPWIMFLASALVTVFVFHGANGILEERMKSAWERGVVISLFNVSAAECEKNKELKQAVYDELLPPRRRGNPADDWVGNSICEAAKTHSDCGDPAPGASMVVCLNETFLDSLFNKMNEEAGSEGKGLVIRPEALNTRLTGTSDGNWLEKLVGLKRIVPASEADSKLFEYTKGPQTIGMVGEFLGGAIRRLQSASSLDRRITKLINGPVQWVTVWVSLWCVTILLTRLAWLLFQRQTILGRGLVSIDRGFLGVRGPWQQSPTGGYEHLTRALTSRRGTILPFRLIIDLVRRGDGGRVETVEGTIDELVDEYDQAIAEREYTLVSWQITVVPMLGFIGTVLGMILAMSNVGGIVGTSGEEQRNAMDSLAGQLGTAFDTTLIALVLAIFLEFLRGAVQDRESAVLSLLRRQASIELAPVVREVIEGG